MLTVLLSVFLGILKGSTLPAPSNVRFLSKNLQNVLHWKSPEENEARMWYTVQYKIYGESWKDKIECQNITKTYCDLSSETEDYDDYYYARVKAVSGASFSDWNQSSRFNPKGETNISAPRVYVEATNCSIAITFIGPEIWKSNNQTPVNPSLIDIFELKYNVSIFNKNSKKTVRGSHVLLESKQL
uniref:Fibronectin type-III domain-containing protein n=1 Tax=Callorhinchus milii TaxID=7868 RepID=A0A4W3K3V3_CALMI